MNSNSVVSRFLLGCAFSSGLLVGLLGGAASARAQHPQEIALTQRTFDDRFRFNFRGEATVWEPRGPLTLRGETAPSPWPTFSAESDAPPTNPVPLPPVHAGGSEGRMEAVETMKDGGMAMLGGVATTAVGVILYNLIPNCDNPDNWPEPAPNDQRTPQELCQDKAAEEALTSVVLVAAGVVIFAAGVVVTTYGAGQWLFSQTDEKGALGGMSVRACSRCEGPHLRVGYSLRF